MQQSFEPTFIGGSRSESSVLAQAYHIPFANMGALNLVLVQNAKATSRAQQGNYFIPQGQSIAACRKIKEIWNNQPRSIYYNKTGEASFARTQTVFEVAMKLIPSSIFYLIAIIILAHFFAPPEYLWTENTISELAAQGLPNQWIQQLGFIGFGLLLNAGFVMKFIHEKRVIYKDLPILVYGLAVGLTGIFSAAPFLENVSYSANEAELHSALASVAGIAFSVGIVIYILRASTNEERLLHTIYLLLVLGSSIAFGLAENGSLPIGKGVTQRLLYLVSFIWLLVGQRRYAKTQIMKGPAQP